MTDTLTTGKFSVALVGYGSDDLLVGLGGSNSIRRSGSTQATATFTAMWATIRPTKLIPADWLKNLRGDGIGRCGMGQKLRLGAFSTTFSLGFRILSRRRDRILRPTSRQTKNGDKRTRQPGRTSMLDGEAMRAFRMGLLRPICSKT